MIEPIRNVFFKRYALISFFVMGLIIYFVMDEVQKISQTPIHSWSHEQEADCGVVLTGGQGRVAEGMSLLNQKRIKKLVISGVNPKSSLREIFPAIPFYGDINDDDIILEKRSKTTFGNAQHSAALIEALNCKSILLITSKTHMRRAKQVFLSTLPEDIRVIERSVYSHSIDASLYDFSLEVIKSLFYRLWAY